MKEGRKVGRKIIFLRLVDRASILGGVRFLDSAQQFKSTRSTSLREPEAYSFWPTNKKSFLFHKDKSKKKKKKRQVHDLVLRSCMRAKSLQSCLTLCKPMVYSPPGSSVQGMLQTRILEWVAPGPGIEPAFPAAPALQSDSLLLSHQGRPQFYLLSLLCVIINSNVIISFLP